MPPSKNGQVSIGVPCQFHWDVDAVLWTCRPDVHDDLALPSMQKQAILLNRQNDRIAAAHLCCMNRIAKMTELPPHIYAVCVAYTWSASPSFV